MHFISLHTVPALPDIPDKVEQNKQLLYPFECLDILDPS